MRITKLFFVKQTSNAVSKSSLESGFLEQFYWLKKPDEIALKYYEQTFEVVLAS
jgi:hypothetical protein